jgi:hypothetical protein
MTVVHGDFSNSVTEGFAGVLFQEGRVHLDVDETTQTLITTNWQDTAARDTIGADVVAAPAAARDSLRIEAADLAAGAVTLIVHPGRVWADGLLVRLDEPTLAAPILRRATYLQPPAQSPAATEGTIANGVRDAVILEVWREAINGFQMPEVLIEPALGGPDTTERLNTGFAFKLYRLEADETCHSIAEDLDDKGKLTVTLQPTVAIGGDCPVIEGGGYTGLEHSLYRIEIADAAGDPQFKWSRFNGGLVGRALFDAVALRAIITANLQAITSSGLESFYLEALRFDTDWGHWRVVYGANVTLDAEDRFVLPNAAGTTMGAIPGGADDVFIRLWDGIRLVSQFPTNPNPTELENGIRLEFDANAPGRYTPGDYWTFSLRAGEIHNPEVLIDAEAPEGIRYHRVPLAELEWDGTNHLDIAEGTIEDCRVVFDPLTRIETCCTYHVGDGINSHGDFTSIQEAINALPAAGGEVCILEGVFRENVLIERRVNVTVSGCGHRDRSRVIATEVAQPIFHVVDARAVSISGLSIIAHDNAQGVLLDDETAEERGVEASGALRDVTLRDLHIMAATEPAIEAHGCLEGTIQECLIEMEDVPTVRPAIFFQGDDTLIERNVVHLRNRRTIVDRQFEDTLRANLNRGEWQPADLARLYQNVSAAKLPTPATLGFGGIQIGGLSDRVHVDENLILGGVSNGITLGSLMLVRANDDVIGRRIVGWVLTPQDPCPPGDLTVPDDQGGAPNDAGGRLISAGPLRDIYIERNHIMNMGLNGIGVVGFFNLSRTRALITVEHLTIRGNEIMRCLRRTIANIRDNMSQFIGYGGISLAHVERLLVRENLIRDNGPDYLTPTCGIYLLFGEGVQIDDNRIISNGARTDDSTDGARPGPRAGAFILAALTPPEGFGISPKEQLPMGEDVPALSLHDNLISQPLGPALNVMALGPVSVHANSLSSQGIVPRRAGASFLGATVNILNLGLSEEEGGGKFFTAIVALVLAGALAGGVSEAGDLIIRPILEFLRRGLVLPTGKVLFSDNQCQLDLVAEREKVIRIRERALLDNQPTAVAAAAWQVLLSISSISILSLDDVGFHDNQCYTNLAFGTLLTNAHVIASSVRVTDNRFKEGPQDVVYSGVTLGEINTTSHNQATHCLLILPSTAPRGVSDGNIVVQVINNPEECLQRTGILS